MYSFSAVKFHFFGGKSLDSDPELDPESDPHYPKFWIRIHNTTYNRWPPFKHLSDEKGTKRLIFLHKNNYQIIRHPFFNLDKKNLKICGRKRPLPSLKF